MKKSLKVILLAVLMLVMVLALTGCGNKVVATRKAEDDEKYSEEKLEFTFKKDKVTRIKVTMTFDSKDEAEEYAEDYNEFLEWMNEYSDEDVKLPELKASGKSVVIDVTAEEYAEMFGEDLEEMQETSRKELKENLEEAGYKVK